MVWLNENWFKIAIIIILSITIFVLRIDVKNKSENSQLYVLKADCFDRSIKYAEERSHSDEDTTYSVEVEKSLYNNVKKSCFAELNISLSNSVGFQLREKIIRDVLAGEGIVSYMYYNSELVDNPLGYLAEGRDEYEAVHAEIFGLSGDKQVGQPRI